MHDVVQDILARQQDQNQKDQGQVDGNGAEYVMHH